MLGARSNKQTREALDTNFDFLFGMYAAQDLVLTISAGAMGLKFVYTISLHKLGVDPDVARVGPLIATSFMEGLIQATQQAVAYDWFEVDKMVEYTDSKNTLNIDKMIRDLGGDLG